MRDTGEQIVQRVRLRPEHRPTGNTRHTVNGIVVEPPAELRIVQFNGDAGFYLIHFDERGRELTDTYHESCEEAMGQAEFEFGIAHTDWT